MIRLVGVMLAVAGGVLLWTGLNARESLTERATQALTGKYSENTTLYIAGGGAALAGGILLALLGGGSRKRR
ncbi:MULTISPECIES: DUF3185 family protein [unclassified Myxococcus]|uniref:DUF3185 family protein n=1 Tax=Myxococcus llanfairpwllgwyngyllgogerychwyrndrobwllllantysiliogogogochensis TaxID=2590453 RepID=A0A540WV93_9BACT|nr:MULTISPECIES: DUF3185 family protein [unclassified Myxococcus]TQF12945.1 DUF3185 family protein [Myxococcus llanfairpwllgwyngyllgogerychwyrndrobwllllantysiliogogogochensis]